MEKYIAIVLLSSLGFIAYIVARCLGDSHSKRGEFDSIMVYATYSFFSVTLSLFAASVLGMFSSCESFIDIERKFIIPTFTIKFLLISILCSVFVGAFWQLCGRKIMLSSFNFINKLLGENIIFLNSSLLNRIFDDGKDHFLVIEKGGKEIAVGFYRAISSPKSEKIELLLTTHPKYKEWLKYAREKDSSHPLNTTLDTYIDVTNDIVITELDYPKDWITS